MVSTNCTSGEPLWLTTICATQPSPRYTSKQQTTNSRNLSLVALTGPARLVWIPAKAAPHTSVLGRPLCMRSDKYSQAKARIQSVAATDPDFFIASCSCKCVGVLKIQGVYWFLIVPVDGQYSGPHQTTECHGTVSPVAKAWRPLNQACLAVSKGCDFKPCRNQSACKILGRRLQDNT